MFFLSRIRKREKQPVSDPRMGSHFSCDAAGYSARMPIPGKELSVNRWSGKKYR